MLRIETLVFSLGILSVSAKPQFPNFGSFNPTVNVQNCQSSQCNQNNIGGGGGGIGGGGGGGFNLGVNLGVRPPGFFSQFQPNFSQQNCLFSQCSQNNFRGRREAESVRLGCEGGVRESSCGNSHCEIRCADGTLHSLECGSGSLGLSSSTDLYGKVVVTVSCQSSPLPSCFPFCGTKSGGFGRRKK